MTLVGLANAVADWLNSRGWSVALTAEYAPRPRHTLSELESDIRVSVRPAARTAARSSRAAVAFSHQLEIGVQSRVTDGRPLDSLIDLIGEIMETIAVERFGDHVPTVVENSAPYIGEHLIEQNVFTSVIAVTFQRLV